MSQVHLLRVGALGNVGRFLSVDAVRYPRGSRVVARTARGLETAQVLTHGGGHSPSASLDGSILRGMTVEDDLLVARLHKYRHKAYSACAARLTEMGLGVTLMDVEPLFDGKTLVFYFLGERPPELQGLIDELTELYEAKVQFRRFTEVATAGCGPGCGTDQATGGGCGTACGGGCALAGACSVRSA